MAVRTRSDIFTAGQMDFETRRILIQNLIPRSFSLVRTREGVRHPKIRFIRPDGEGNDSVLFYANKLWTNAKRSTKNAQFVRLTKMLTNGTDDLTVQIGDWNHSFCMRADVSECKCYEAQKHCLTVFEVI
jgi:hypothetical protein